MAELKCHMDVPQERVLEESSRYLFPSNFRLKASPCA